MILLFELRLGGAQWGRQFIWGGYGEGEGLKKGKEKRLKWTEMDQSKQRHLKAFCKLKVAYLLQVLPH